MTFNRTGAPARPTRFYIVMALVALAVALTGFAGTFFIPLGQGRFAAPPIIFIHGGLFFGWILLFVTQPSLIRAGHWRLHQKLGAVGGVIALAMAASGVAVGHYAAKRDLAAGAGEFASSSLVGVCTAMLMFLGLVAAGIAFRRRPEVHKRLMLLATIAVLWPAWFRFRHYFPAVPNPEIWFAVVAADSLILVCMIRDRLALGGVHPVYLWVGSGIIIEHAIEVVLFDSPPWRVVSHALMDLLG
jgi:hypothetical protein